MNTYNISSERPEGEYVPLLASLPAPLIQSSHLKRCLYNYLGSSRNLAIIVFRISILFLNIQAVIYNRECVFSVFLNR